MRPRSGDPLPSGQPPNADRVSVTRANYATASRQLRVEATSSNRNATLTAFNDTTGAQTEKHQTRMMGEIAKLVADQPKGIGYLEEADYQRTVDILLKGSSDPVITKKPVGAWTHDVWDKAMKK